MTRKKPDPGVTPIENLTLTYAETGQPVPRSDPPPRRRRAPLGVDPTPAYAGLQALAEQIDRARILDDAERTAAGLRAGELRRECRALDAELAEVKDLVKLHKRTLPGTLLPTSLVAKFDRLCDSIGENERQMFEVRRTLAGDVGLERADLAHEKQQAEAERERRARAVKTATALEAARRQGRKEYAALHGILGRVRPPSSVSDPEAASSAPAEMIARTALNCVDHDDHWSSQRVRLADGSTGWIFTGR